MGSTFIFQILSTGSIFYHKSVFFYFIFLVSFGDFALNILVLIKFSKLNISIMNVSIV